MRPIFFSVASTDVKYAEKIWERLPADLVYLYSKSGVEGEHMWREISDKELAHAQFFVAFWSKRFVQASGCLKELAQAKSQVQSGKLVPLVLRLDDFPITFQPGLGDDLKTVFEHLKVLLDYRTSRTTLRLNDAISLVSRVVEPALKDNHPRLPRGEILDNLARATRRAEDGFSCYPAMWISGFNGTGRLSLIKELSRSYSGENRCLVVEISEASLPKQILLHIHDEAFGGGKEALDQINSDPESDKIRVVARKIEDAVSAGKTIVLRHHRVVEEGVELPEWIDDLVKQLKPKNRTQLFVISQIPLTATRRTACDGLLGEFRVPTMSEGQTEDFAKQLISELDPMPSRWSNRIAELTQLASGNIGFLVSLIRSAARIDDPDEIVEMLRRDHARMAESITGYVIWAFKQLSDYPQEQKALLILNDISPIHHEDLAKILGNEKPTLQVLGKLLSLGLIERDDGGLYRLVPLLSRRLSHHIVRTDAKDWYRKALRKFAETPPEFSGEGDDMVKIESRISVSLWQGEAELNPDVAKYVSASHWFQVGVRLYHAQHREPAFRLLSKAFNKRDSFRDTSRAELTRYYGLSAIRNGKAVEAQVAIDLLNRSHNTKSVAKYLEAFREESKRNYKDALTLYEDALSLNSGNPRRLERIYRPLIKCIFKSGWPDYVKAERHALAWIRMRDTFFAKMALAQTYLNWWKKGASQNRAVPEDIRQKYEASLNDLKNSKGISSAYYEIKSEQARLEGNYEEAIKFSQLAVESDPGRFELRLERWQLMVESGNSAICSEAIGELESARKNPDYLSNWRPFLPSLTEVFARALVASGSFDNGRLQRFASGLSSAEIGAAVSMAKKGGPMQSVDI